MQLEQRAQSGNVRTAANVPIRSKLRILCTSGAQHVGLKVIDCCQELLYLRNLLCLFHWCIAETRTFSNTTILLVAGVGRDPCMGTVHLENTVLNWLGRNINATAIKVAVIKVLH